MCERPKHHSVALHCFIIITGKETRTNGLSRHNKISKLMKSNAGTLFRSTTQVL